MAAIPRAYQKLFAGNYASAPTGSLPVFGSLAASSVAWAADVPGITSLPAWLGGWSPAVVGTDSPALEDFNSIFYVAFLQLAYLFQAGIPEWDSQTTYYNLKSFATSGGAIYQSLQDNNTNNAVTNPSYWRVWGSDLYDPLGAAATAQSNAQAFATASIGAAISAINPQLAQAWIVFDGVNMFVYNSYNLASLTKLGTGHYVFAWNGTYTNPAPALSGSCGDSAGGNGGILQARDNINTNQIGFICSVASGSGFTPADRVYICAVIHTQ